MPTLDFNFVMLYIHAQTGRITRRQQHTPIISPTYDKASSFQVAHHPVHFGPVDTRLAAQLQMRGRASEQFGIQLCLFGVHSGDQELLYQCNAYVLHGEQFIPQNNLLLQFKGKEDRMDHQDTSSSVAGDDYQKNFQAEDYRTQNYTEILAEDRFFIECTTQSTLFSELGIQPQTFTNAIDVGNAGTMIAPGILAPFMKDNGEIILADVGYRQMHLIAKTIKKGRRGHLGIWQKFEDLMAQNPFWKDAIQRACKLSKPQDLSVFDLEPNSVDAGAMCYVAESITDSKQEFETIASTFLEAIRPGGLVIWSGIIGSQGYDSAGDMFRAHWIEPQDMLDVADDQLRNIHLLYRSSSDGARAHTGPRYSGMALLVGIKR